MNYTKLTIFYEIGHFEGKWTRFVAVLAQNTCVCVVVDHYYTISKSILVYQEGSWSLGWESQIQFHSNLTIYYQTSPYFGGNLTSFVAVLDQNTCVQGSRSLLQYSEVIIILLGRFMKPGMGIIDKFQVQPHHFLQSQSPFLRKLDQFCGWSGPKRMCVWFQTGTTPLELQYLFIKRFTTTGLGIVDGHLLQPRHFLPSQSPFLRKSDQFCSWSGQKHMHV